MCFRTERSEQSWRCVNTKSELQNVWSAEIKSKLILLAECTCRLRREMESLNSNSTQVARQWFNGRRVALHTRRAAESNVRRHMMSNETSRRPTTNIVGHHFSLTGNSRPVGSCKPRRFRYSAGHAAATRYESCWLAAKQPTKKFRFGAERR